LLDLFTKITDLEKIPEDWHKGIIKPIHKGGSMYKTKKRIGDRTHPCFSPSSWSNQSDSKSPKRTLLLTLLLGDLKSFQHLPWIPFFHNRSNKPSREMQGAFRRKDGRRTTFLLYKGYVHLKNQKWVRHSSPFLTFLKLLTEFGGKVYLTYYEKMVFRVNVGNS
jgi:hypothetical protein